MSYQERMSTNQRQNQKKRTRKEKTNDCQKMLMYTHTHTHTHTQNHNTTIIRTKYFQSNYKKLVKQEANTEMQVTKNCQG
jgi:hypothetical protein